MVAREGGYYGTEFQGARGVTQGDPLSPTIFNMVVGAVVRHWVTVMVEGEKERGERGNEGRHQDALFYADNFMVASLDPHWLQGAFSTLVVLFDKVSMRTNFGKTVNMVCRPLQAVWTQLEVVYRRQITGEGSTYQDQQKGRFQCR